MNKIPLLIFSLVVFSFGCSHSQVKSPETINIDAIKLNHQAMDSYFNSLLPASAHDKTLKKALNLLNQAIAIDSNYYGAYSNKMVFQAELNQPDSAFVIAKLIVKKWPKDESTIITLGKYYELKGDSASAYQCYKNALSDIELVLKSTTDSNKEMFFQIEKAKALMLLNQPQQADNILKSVMVHESNQTVKTYLNRLMIMGRPYLLQQKPAPKFI